MVLFSCVIQSNKHREGGSKKVSHCLQHTLNHKSIQMCKVQVAGTRDGSAATAASDATLIKSHVRVLATLDHSVLRCSDKDQPANAGRARCTYTLADMRHLPDNAAVISRVWPTKYGNNTA
jgi:hypothetical protein